MKIYILYTGGTIGCVGTPLSPMDGEAFSETFTQLMTPTIESELPGSTVTIESFDHTLDSTNMQPSEWVIMAQRIAKNFAQYDAFVVLHGTDTMAWTSSALSFLLPGVSKPVTVTGSQLPLFSETKPDGPPYQLLYNTDAVRNVLGAIRFFTMDVPEVTLYFADQLFRGNRVVKSNSSQFTAFSSPNYPTLGVFGVLPTVNSQYTLPVPKSKSLSLDANLKKVRAHLEQISKTISMRSVMQLQTFPGYYSEDGSQSLIASMMGALRKVSPPLAGVIFESYGIGNIPSFSSMQQQLKQMHDDGLVLVDCTQVYQGGVDYNEYATGAWLKDVGVIGGQDMSPIASMAKLTVLLASMPNATQVEIEYAMAEESCGEMLKYYALSGYQNDYLVPGESIFSINGLFEFSNEVDGYIRVLDVSGKEPVELWKQGVGSPGRVKMFSDNDLVYFDEKKEVTWHSNTAATGFTSYLKICNDSALKLFNLDNDELVATIFDGAPQPATIGAPTPPPRRIRKRMNHFFDKWIR